MIDDERPADLPAADPILVRRAQWQRFASVGQRVGYGLYGLAVVVFVAGLLTRFTETVSAVVIASVVVGSIVLAPAIVFGYAVKAADREDRERGTPTD